MFRPSLHHKYEINLKTSQTVGVHLKYFLVLFIVNLLQVVPYKNSFVPSWLLRMPE